MPKSETSRHSPPRSLLLKPTLALGSVALLFLSSCTGGSSSPGGGGANSASLPGTIFATTTGFPRTGTVWSIEASSRVAEQQFTLDRDDGSLPEYGISRRYVDTPYSDNGDLLFGVNRCLDSNGSDIFCVERISLSGNVQRLFSSDGYLRGPPAVSPDGSLVAAAVSTGLIDGPTYIDLYSSDGTLLEEQAISVRTSDIDVSTFAWTSDNRLIYGIQFDDQASGVVITEPGSLATSDDHPFDTLLVDPMGQNTIRNVSLSGDSRYLAYDVVPDTDTGNGATRVFVLDLTNGETTPLASNTNRDVWAPVWSPDGQYLLVNHAVLGFTSDAVPVAPGIGGTLPFQMLVEWTGDPVIIDVYDDDGEVIVDEALFVVDATASTASTTINERWLFDEGKIWLP